MILVDQNKRGIINFNNILEIAIQKENDEFRIVAFASVISSTWIVLGRYKTEERAKEVLQEIIKNYQSKMSINYKGLLSEEHERALYKKYKNLLENTNIFINDERKKIKYIPCQKNVFYMPEE